MPTLPENSVDTIITDPPYGLGFMGKDWDHGVPGVAFWVEALRVAKPGAMLLAFGGTRTHHRLMVAIEDAGWEIRDAIFWAFGSGFPKSHNIGKATESEQWAGYGTALKPAYEIIIVAMKPLDGTFANNALKWKVAGLNIDGARVPTNGDKAPFPAAGYGRHASDASYCFAGDPKFNTTGEDKNPDGRWPANLVHDGSDEVVGLFPESKSAGHYTNSKGKPENSYPDAMFGAGPGYRERVAPYSGETGSAARFFQACEPDEPRRLFYTAKASRAERNAGLEGMEAEPIKGRDSGQDERSVPYKQRPSPVTNHHPTIKPLSLMRYLARLTKAPTGGVVLDPFMGSGSTGCAAVLEGRDFIGIEMDADYAEIARRRIEHWQAVADEEAAKPEQLSLLDN
jgi:site-specific DNA-methyltransferase (adenine-specific)